MRPALSAPTMSWGLGSLLIAQGGTQGRSADIIFWAGVLAVAGVVLGVSFFLIRKWLLRDDEEAGPIATGFTLADLRQMHAEGQLSDAEFEVAKTKMLARLQSAAEATTLPQSTESREPPASMVTDLGDITPPAKPADKPGPEAPDPDKIDDEDRRNAQGGRP